MSKVKHVSSSAQDVAVSQHTSEKGKIEAPDISAVTVISGEGNFLKVHNKLMTILSASITFQNTHLAFSWLSFFLNGMVITALVMSTLHSFCQFKDCFMRSVMSSNIYFFCASVVFGVTLYIKVYMQGQLFMSSAKWKKLFQSFGRIIEERDNPPSLLENHWMLIYSLIIFINACAAISDFFFQSDHEKGAIANLIGLNPSFSLEDLIGVPLDITSVLLFFLKTISSFHMAIISDLLLMTVVAFSELVKVFRKELEEDLHLFKKNEENGTPNQFDGKLLKKYRDLKSIGNKITSVFAPVLQCLHVICLFESAYVLGVFQSRVNPPHSLFASSLLNAVKFQTVFYLAHKISQQNDMVSKWIRTWGMKGSKNMGSKHDVGVLLHEVNNEPLQVGNKEFLEPFYLNNLFWWAVMVVWCFR